MASRRRGRIPRAGRTSWSPGSSRGSARSRRGRATAWASSRSRIARGASKSSYTEPFARFERLIENGALVVVRGRLDKDEEESRLYASDIAPIETVRERLARELAITVSVPPHGRQTFEALAALFEQHRGDKPVTLQLEIRNGGRPLRVRAQVSPQIRVKPSQTFLAAVQKLCGDGSVLLR